MTPEAQRKYPDDDEIRVSWSRPDIAILVTIAVGLLALSLWRYEAGDAFTLGKVCSIAGLYVGIVGVVTAARKTPFFGLFMDGGAVQRKREIAETKSFQRGMWLVAAGLLLQAVGVF